LALSRLKDEIPLRVELCYVDHALRPDEELGQERETLVKNAEKMGLPLHLLELGKGSVERESALNGSGLEAAARSLRYRALRDKMRERGIRWLATGHTLDDQDETTVMRFFMGSGPRGMRGIRETHGDLIRPILGARHEEIREVLRSEGVPWSEDSTNSSSAFMRNRVRTRLMPAIGEHFPGFRKALETGRKKAAMVESLLDEMAKGLFEERDGALSAELVAFISLPKAVRLHCLEAAAAEIRPGKRIPFSALLAAIEKAQGGRENEVLAIASGLRIRILGDRIVAEAHLAHRPKKGYFFPVRGPAAYDIPGAARYLLHESTDRSAGPAVASLRLPAALRSSRPHDRIRSRDGTKAVASLAREWGLGAGTVLPVLEDSGGIACAYGAPWGRANRCAERGYAHRDDDTFLGLEVRERGVENGY
jgi:tRNA(Ile)-lysidine synthase